MARIDAKIEVEAPVEKVFDFVAKVVDNHPKFFRFVQKVEVTSEVKRGTGSTFRYEVKSAGIKNTFENQVTKYVENEMMEWESIAGMKNKGGWYFVPIEKGTEVTFVMDYELPASYLGKVLDKLFVEKENRKDVHASLQNLKSILES